MPSKALTAWWGGAGRGEEPVILCDPGSEIRGEGETIINGMDSNDHTGIISPYVYTSRVVLVTIVCCPVTAVDYFAADAPRARNDRVELSTWAC